jgi:Holliday junction resolvase RusA-like endonuclease
MKATVMGPVNSQGSKKLAHFPKRVECPRCHASYVTRWPRLLDDNDQLKAWRRTVRQAMAETAPAAPLDAPMLVRLTVAVERPADHYGTGRNAGKLKPNAPMRPKVGRDLDKVLRAVLDAGTGVWWLDDSRVAEIYVRRVYCLSPGGAGLQVTAEELGEVEHG